MTVNSAANSFAPTSTAPCVGASPNCPTIHMSPTPISAVATLVTMAGSAIAQIRRLSMDGALVDVGLFKRRTSRASLAS